MKYFLRSILAVLALALPTTSPAAELVEKTIEYQQGKKTFEGFLVYDGDLEGKRPGVLIIHQWTGISEHERGVARELARLGYTAFCADIYGKGIRPSAGQEASKTSGPFREDRSLYRERLNLGLETMKKQPQTDPEATAVIGYCFGGTGALELARSGADIRAAVSFHGGLGNPNPESVKNIRAAIQVHHGADDPYEPMENVNAFIDRMKATDLDWQVSIYANAVHSFTEESDRDTSDGAGYNRKADERSWAAMKMLLENRLYAD